MNSIGNLLRAWASMVCQQAYFWPLLCCWAIAVCQPGLADEVDESLAAIARVGPQSAGSTDAQTASQRLAAQDADILPRLLAAMDTDNPVAANWYRTAYEQIVERQLAREGAPFPKSDLRQFVADPRHVGRVRRLALALYERLEPGYTTEHLPKMLDDPEFRGDAVELALARGQQALNDGDSKTARDEFRSAFDYARDGAQTVRAADKLAGLGEKVDIAAHLGLVTDWRLLGPFEAPGFSGFAQVFPPEQRVDLAARYTGQEGRELSWTRFQTSDPLGLVNLVAALGPVKEAVGYAFARLRAPREQTAQLRCGADDNCTVWLNGQRVFGREQWLNGIRFDRFTTPVQLREGDNTVLVKVCQGPQHKNPQVSNDWSLQLRFCDADGRGVSFRNVSGEATETK